MVIIYKMIRGRELFMITNGIVKLNQFEAKSVAGGTCVCCSESFTYEVPEEDLIFMGMPCCNYCCLAGGSTGWILYDDRMNIIDLGICSKNNQTTGSYNAGDGKKRVVIEVTS